MKSMKEHSENEVALTEKELEGVVGGTDKDLVKALYEAAEADCKRMEDMGFERPQQRYSFMIDGLPSRKG